MEPAQYVLCWMVGLGAILFGIAIGELAFLYWFVGGLLLIWPVARLYERKRRQ